MSAADLQGYIMDLLRQTPGTAAADEFRTEIAHLLMRALGKRGDRAWSDLFLGCGDISFEHVRDGHLETFTYVSDSGATFEASMVSDGDDFRVISIRYEPTRDLGLKWLKGYHRQTTKQLLGLQGTHRPDSIVLALEAGLQARSCEQCRETPTDTEMVIIAVEAFEREVNNGGFVQLVANAESILPSIPGAMASIGRSDLAELVLDAIARVPENPNGMRSADFEDLDDRFATTPGDLATELLRYVEANQEHVHLPCRCKAAEQSSED